MRLLIYSDLHLEFGPFEAETEGADVCILAGDIHVGERGLEWIRKLAAELPVIYVLGNHEYYGQKYPRLLEKMRAKVVGSGIHLLEDESVVIGDATFHGATLWADFQLLGRPQVAMYDCEQVMNDFKKIRKLPGYSKVRAADMIRWHRHSLNWLGQSLKSSTTGKDIVVTHHAPSPRSVPDDFRGDTVSAAYASDLDDFIVEHGPDLWVHGHTHNTQDYRVGDCRVVCNPRGYVGELNPGFRRDLVIDVNGNERQG